MIAKNKVVVFDLDDTLCKEVLFLQSAFLSIASLYPNSILLYNQMINVYRENKDVFQFVVSYDDRIAKEELIQFYRNHKPCIALDDDTLFILDYLQSNKIELGIITDGRSVTQSNKLNALGLQRYIKGENIIISEEFGTEKPSVLNYQFFMQKYPNALFYYIGDNIKKDFLAPNKLGWITIGLLDNGLNIHKQSREYPQEYLPQYFVSNIKEIIGII